MDFTKLPDFIYYIVCAADVIVSALLVVFFKLKNKDLKKVAQIKDQIIDKSIIFQRIPDYIVEAENLFGPGNGPAKLSYVLNKLHIDFLENGLVFDKVVATEQVEAVLETPQKKEEV